jgi:hypothetical protein
MPLAFRVEHSKSAAYSQARTIIFEAVNELEQDGLSPSHVLMPVNEDDEVLYACTNEFNDIVGVICYRAFPEVATVGVAYVEPSSRREGVMSALWAELKKRVSGSRVIVPIHANNKVGLEVATKLGALQRSVVCEFGPSR